MSMDEPRPLAPKKPAASVAVVSELMMPHQVNNLGHVFGGELLSMVDRAAAVAAMRHAGSASVTVSIDRVDFVERHPLGSQAFVPLTPCRMIVVVGPPGEAVSTGDLRAFVTNGRQGVNYRRGTWHMPLIAFEPGQEFLVIDRAGDEPNCEQHHLDENVMLVDV